MQPVKASRLLKRISSAISLAKYPRKEAVSEDLQILMKALSGDKEAELFLNKKFASKIPVLKDFDSAFISAGLTPPELKRVGLNFVGSIGKVNIKIQVESDKIQKVLVANRPVKDWPELVQAAKYYLAMSDDGTPETEEDIQKARDVLESNTFPCAGCGKELNIDSDITCPHCGVDHVFCPGCNKPHNMVDNENDHCPLCGYSSWGMADHTSEELKKAILIALEANSDEFAFANAKWSFSNPPDDVKEELKYAFNDPPVNKDDMQDMADAYATAYSSYLDEYMWKKGLL